MNEQRRKEDAKAHRKEYGEGNYVAARKYQDATKRLVESGSVEEAARAAEPQSDADALQLAAAETEGKRRAKEEDPLLTQRARPAPRPPEARETPCPGGPEDE